MSQENISMSVKETPQTTNVADTNAATNVQDTPNQVKLVDALIDSQNMALNVMVGFIGVAQKRGVFSLDESAKLYECIKMFQGVSVSEHQTTN